MAKYDPTLDRVFTALGDPTRRTILARLAQGPASVSELAAPHAMSLPSFLGHLARLETAGLVTTAKLGRIRTCTLVPNAFCPAQDWLSAQRSLWQDRLDQFDAYVTTLIKDRDHEA